MFLSACGSMASLDRDIASRRDEIGKVLAEIEAASGALLKKDADLVAEVRYRPIAQYLQEVTDSGLTITAVGVERAGEFWYQGGFGKAWLHPPQHAKARVTIAKVRLDGAPGGAAWSGTISAAAEARASFDILNVKGDVPCNGKLADTVASGTLGLATGPDSSVAYVLNLARPDSVVVRVSCNLGSFGNKDASITVSDLARQLPKGTFGVGFASEGTVEVPVGSSTRLYRYKLAARNPTLTPLPNGLEYKSNIAVELAPSTH
jgi:hypothetical protein